jgi:hypothetical protein
LDVARQGGLAQIPSSRLPTVITRARRVKGDRGLRDAARRGGLICPGSPSRAQPPGPLRERKQLRKARGSGRNQLAHGDNHGIRSPRGVSVSPPWRATSCGGLISRCTGLFQHVLGQPPFNPADWNGTEPLDFRRDRDRGSGCPLTPPTPPYVRSRIRRFRDLSP